jgi:7-keto-8-aminopelargonate synthetase-like enzyme
MKESRLIDSRETSLHDFLNAPSTDIFNKACLFSNFVLDGRKRGYEVYLKTIEEYRGSRALVRGIGDLNAREVVVFCSADYLGLARHPSVIKAVQDVAAQYGPSVSSVPLIAGATSIHRELESRISNLIGTETAVLFPTGHAANIGAIPAFCQAGDTLVVDKNVHASILANLKPPQSSKFASTYCASISWIFTGEIAPK